ncbi:MAG: MBL fold metallo-hydrolase [Actinomycetota bacterium]|nr:MBL fold metallo-hydrolase [Actinomycetota bacterium]
MKPIREVADGVWLVAGGRPLPTMNVYLLEEQGGGVTMFDAGVSSMTRQLRIECKKKGGLNRILLGHGHADHRGAAPGLGAPVLCHADNVSDAEGDGGQAYMDLSKLPLYGRPAYRVLLRAWDGGPVKVSGTVEEGEEVCGFKVVLLSGHAPGQIALFREKDGVALTSDCFYTIDPLTGIRGKPRIPHAAFNEDQEATRGSIRKLAELDPASAWPGHANPLTEDVKDELLRVAGERT